MARALAFTASMAAMASVRAQDCYYDFGNSSFNLLPYQMPFGQPYKVQDSRNINLYSANYTYFFNICRNVNPLTLTGNPNPSLWKWPACNCTDRAGTAQSQWCTDPGSPGDPSVYLGAPAFQVANTNRFWNVPDADLCHMMGGPLATGANPTVSYMLVDTKNPSRGVGIKYSGGDSCGIGKPSRSLTVWLQCDDDITNKPDTEPVFETGHCAYEIYVKTAYGCPTQCAINNNKLCGGHGICEFDSALRNSKCFCNDGWTGSDCSSPAGTSGGLSATANGLIVVCVFLTCTLGFLGFLWFRIRTLRLDPQAYSALRSGPEAEDKSSLNAPSFSSS